MKMRSSDVLSVDQENPAAEAVIIVPSYGRPRQLETCLFHLARLEGGPWTVIVVDDGSPEPLAPVCATAGPHVSCLRRENGGPGAARNTGAEAAQGKRWLLFTDDDCRPRPDWALRLIAAQGGVSQRLAGGHIKNALQDNVYSSASQSLASYLYDHYAQRQSQMAFFTTNNMCCLRRDFLAVGGFDPAFRQASEDRDLSLRWRDAGGTMVTVPEAVVDHAHDLDLLGFWRQQASYGRGARRLHRSMNGRGDARAKLERLSFYFRLLTWPVGRSRRPMTETALMGLSQIALAAGYVQARLAERTEGFRKLDTANKDAAQ